LAKVAIEDLEVDYINIKTTFLNPTLFEEIFIKPIKYLERIFPELKEKDIYLKLNKALYSLKQSPYK
jgi:hypothetical protein